MPGIPGSSNGLPLLSLLNDPMGVTLVPNSSSSVLYIMEACRVRLLALPSAATGGLGDLSSLGAQTACGWVDGPVANARFRNPTDMAFTDSSARFAVIADSNNHRIRLYNVANSSVHTLAGNGVAAFANSDVGTLASFYLPYACIVSSFDNTTVIVSDSYNHRLRVFRIVGTAGVNVSTFAGGSAGYVDSLDPSAVAFNRPIGLVQHPATGVLYVCDFQNSRIRAVQPSGATSTLSGLGGGS